MSYIIKAFNFPLLSGNWNLPSNALYHNCISKLLKAGNMATIRPGSSLHYCTLFLLIISRESQNSNLLCLGLFNEKIDQKNKSIWRRSKGKVEENNWGIYFSWNNLKPLLDFWLVKENVLHSFSEFKCESSNVKM